MVPAIWLRRSFHDACITCNEKASFADGSTQNDIYLSGIHVYASKCQERQQRSDTSCYRKGTRTRKLLTFLRTPILLEFIYTKTADVEELTKFFCSFGCQNSAEFVFIYTSSMHGRLQPQRNGTSSMRRITSIAQVRLLFCAPEEIT